ncbi:MAG: hypothetical protein FJW27_14520 [Acidimicrobiia bacterium]|nr:hypothetical protein [Acidimicrobiia bacterium]
MTGLTNTEPVPRTQPSWSSVVGLAVVASLGILCARGVVSASEGEPLKIRVTPAVAQPPAFVTVRADVEAHDDNRSLEVTAEADDFRASRQLPLEGSKGPRFTEIYFDNLPAGAYTVTVVLNGSSGQRARVTRSVLVGSPPDGPQP